jgi:hypothetical protein
MKKLNKLLKVITIMPIIGGVLPFVLSTTSCKKTDIPGFGEITLDNGTKIIVPNEDEFDMLCEKNDSPFAHVTISGITFTLENIIGFQFGSDFNLTVIPEHFLCLCTSFNSSLTIPSCVNTIEYEFLFHCTSFCQKLTIPQSVTTIESRFMDSCYSQDANIYCPGNTSKPNG